MDLAGHRGLGHLMLLEEPDRLPQFGDSHSLIHLTSRREAGVNMVPHAETIDQGSLRAQGIGDHQWISSPARENANTLIAKIQSSIWHRNDHQLTEEHVLFLCGRT